MARPKSSPLAKLQAQIRKAETHLAALRAKAAAAVRAEVEQIATAHGFSLSDLLGKQSAARTKARLKVARPKKAAPVAKTRKRRGKGAKAVKAAAGERAVKGVVYADPSNPKAKWRGFGKRPTWFREAIAAGKTERELRASPAKGKDASSKG
jgi:DNA-binding protein H-NS